MLRRVTTYIRKHGLLTKDKPVLVAVSGGADSISLLDVLLRAGYTCIAAHCNFELRGEESDCDEAFVRNLCERMGVELIVTHFATRVYAREHHISIEMAARDLRYQWFDEMAKSKQCIPKKGDESRRIPEISSILPHSLKKRIETCFFVR